MAVEGNRPKLGVKMAKVMTDESNYSAIASQIRSKLGVSTRYKPSEMAAAIGSISGVSSSDNGKVVVDGQLTQQTSRSVSQNGTYDTTTNNEVVVNVSGGGGSTNIMSGVVIPSASDGDDGDIFILCTDIGVSVNAENGYILTGLTVNDFDKVEAKVLLTEYQSGKYYSLFGVSASATAGASGGKTFRFRDGNSNYGAVGYGGSWYYASSGFFNSGSPYEIEITVKSGTQKVVANGTTILTANGSGALTASKEVALLNNNLNGSPSGSGFKGVLYNCKFYSGDTLLRDFVPSLDNNDVPCLYDNVTRDFFYYSVSDKLSLIDSGTIISIYLKVNGAWVPIEGQDIDDVNIGS